MKRETQPQKSLNSQQESEIIRKTAEALGSSPRISSEDILQVLDLQAQESKPREENPLVIDAKLSPLQIEVMRSKINRWLETGTIESDTAERFLLELNLQEQINLNRPPTFGQRLKNTPREIAQKAISLKKSTDQMLVGYSSVDSRLFLGLAIAQGISMDVSLAAGNYGVALVNGSVVVLSSISAGLKARSHKNKLKSQSSYQ